jgi:hypothetical protein
MGRPQPMAIRLRIVGFVEKGHSHRPAATIGGWGGGQDVHPAQDGLCSRQRPAYAQQTGKKCRTQGGVQRVLCRSGWHTQAKPRLGPVSP